MQNLTTNANNPPASLRPEAVLRALRRLGTPAPRGATPAAPAAAATTATATVAAANDRRDHNEPSAPVPGMALAPRSHATSTDCRLTQSLEPY